MLIGKSAAAFSGGRRRETDSKGEVVRDMTTAFLDRSKSVEDTIVRGVITFDVHTESPRSGDDNSSHRLGDGETVKVHVMEDSVKLT